MEAIALPAPVREAPIPVGTLSEQDWAGVVSSLGLSPQQARIVQLMLEGKGDKQIARGLRLSFGTVRAHLSRVFDRVGVRGRMELAAAVFARVSAMRNGKDSEQP